MDIGKQQRVIMVTPLEAEQADDVMGGHVGQPTDHSEETVAPAEADVVETSPRHTARPVTRSHSI